MRIYMTLSVAFAVLCTLVGCEAVGQFLGVGPDGSMLPNAPIDTVINVGRATGLPWLAWLAPLAGVVRWGYSEVMKIRNEAKAKKYFDAARSTVSALETAFKKADLNGDGKIDADELKKLLMDSQNQAGAQGTIQELLNLLKAGVLPS